MLFGTHPEGIDAVREELRAHFPDRDVELVTDLRAAAADADIVVATAGAHTPAAVEAGLAQAAARSRSWSATGSRPRPCTTPTGSSRPARRR